METFFYAHQTALVWSISILVLSGIMRLLGTKTVRKIGGVGNIAEARIVRVSKYLSLLISALAIAALALIWGIDFKELGLLFSSVFAVIGVALFAQWSILSNVTSGVILFFSFPFKIGDRIQILDKDMVNEDTPGVTSYLIEDIKAYHVHLRNEKGQLIKFPNNMMLQKPITLITNPMEPLADGENN